MSYAGVCQDARCKIETEDPTHIVTTAKQHGEMHSRVAHLKQGAHLFQTRCLMIAKTKSFAVLSLSAQKHLAFLMDPPVIHGGPVRNLMAAGLLGSLLPQLSKLFARTTASTTLALT